MNTLGIDKEPRDTRVVVAMSGGVDSSVAAALLKAEGYEVVGITLQLYDHGAALAKKGACCAGQDIADARRAAEVIGIAHYVLDYESKFREAVIEDFADSYLAGQTPIPCVRCNQTVKFRDLLQTARDLGADALATGHYVRRVMGEKGPELHRAAEDGRDQSYFLFATTPEQLDFLRFPLGHLPKAQTRALATKFGLGVAAKPDSQDICFVPNGSYAAVVAKLRPGAVQPGPIVHADGRALGRHEGIVNFTVGQRRGIGVSDNRPGIESDPLYVIGVEASTRTVTVGPRELLRRDVLLVREVNWLGGPAPEHRVTVKLRSAQPPCPATLWLNEDGTGRIELDAPQYGIAPGQAAVFYDGTRVLGGGWITGAERRENDILGEQIRSTLLNVT